MYLSNYGAGKKNLNTRKRAYIFFKVVVINSLPEIKEAKLKTAKLKRK